MEDGSCSVLKMGLGQYLLDLSTCHSMPIYNIQCKPTTQWINMSDLGFSISLISILGGSLLV